MAWRDVGVRGVELAVLLVSYSACVSIVQLLEEAVREYLSFWVTDGQNVGDPLS